MVLIDWYSQDCCGGGVKKERRDRSPGGNIYCDWRNDALSSKLFCPAVSALTSLPCG